jgi:hypothetical protein
MTDPATEPSEPTTPVRPLQLVGDDDAPTCEDGVCDIPPR